MICEQLNINQRLSTAYHPETDGSTERANQEVETYLRTFVTYEQNDWVKWIPLAQLSINNRPLHQRRLAHSLCFTVMMPALFPQYTRKHL